MTTCDEVRPRLEEHRVDLLDAKERRAVDVHLLECAGCRRRMERVQAIEEALLNTADEDEPQADAVEAALDRVRNRLYGKGMKEVIPMAAAAMLLLGVLLWLSGSRPQVPPAPSASQDRFKVEKLAIPDAVAGDRIVWSPAGNAFAYVDGDESNQSVVVNGKAGEKFQRVGKPVFSPDGARVAHRAVLHDGRGCVVIDGKKESPFGDVSDPLFSPDGRRVAYVSLDLEKDGTVSGGYVVIDGQKGPKFDWYDGWGKSLAWSPDSRRLAYVGSRGSDVYAVVDGEVGEAFNEVPELAWSPDGKRLAFAAKKGADAFVVADGKKGESFDEVRLITFSRDGRRLAYVASEGDDFVVLDGERGPEYSSVIGRLVFRPDEGEVAYVGQRKDGPLYHVQIGRSFRPGPFVEARQPDFAEAGGTCAFAVEHGSPGNVQSVFVSRVRKDGSRSAELLADFETVSDPVVSADGSSVAYWGTKGSRAVVMLNKERVGGYAEVGRLALSPDGKTVAFRAKKYGKWIVVSGKSESEGFDEILREPAFSADGKRVSFVARQGAEAWAKVLDVK